MIEIITDKKTEYSSEYNVVFKCIYHIIFTPKYRRSVLIDEISNRLKELIIEKQEEYNYQIIELEIMPDHVHLLIKINPKISPFNIIAKIKGYSSKILREEFKDLNSKLPSLWTRSSFISTVGSVSLETVQKYIQDQKGV